MNHDKICIAICCHQGSACKKCIQIFWFFSSLSFSPLSVMSIVLTHWGLNIMTTISQTFSDEFLWMKIFLIKIAVQFFWVVKLTISQHWFRYRLNDEQTVRHYPNQWWPCLLNHICITLQRWVKMENWQDGTSDSNILHDSRTCQIL